MSTNSKKKFRDTTVGKLLLGAAGVINYNSLYMSNKTKK